MRLPCIDSYDPLGRPITKRQLFKRNGVVTGYSINQTYDLAGNVKTVKYPSGRTVNYNYDQAGRLSSFTGNLGDGQLRTYSTITQYHQAGMIERETFGTQTPLYQKKRYNNRLQLGDLRLSTGSDALSYDRGALLFLHGPNAVANNDPFANDPTNNGNLVKQAHYVPIAGGGEAIPQTDNYTYDALNRISGVVESNVFTQTYGYDRWGNRQITSATGGANNYNLTYDQGSNRINGLGYDAAGNIISDPMTGGIMTYDAENRMLAATNGSYTYNADGSRVRRITGGQETWYVYGIKGELLAEYAHDGAPSAPLKEYGYRDGQILIVAESGSGGGVSLVKPASQSRSDLIGKIAPGTGGDANRIFSADEPFADLGINKGYGPIAADFSGSDNTGTLMRGGPRTTAEEYGNTPSANGAGVELLAEHPAGAAPRTPQKEYGNRNSLSIATAQSVGSVSPGANQTPDPGQSGTLGVDGISNTGHGSTLTGASAVDIEASPSKNISQAKSARWSSFQGGPSGGIIGLKLKFDWTASGDVDAFVDTGGIASARINFDIEYSIDGGSSWANALSRSRMVSQSGIGEKTDGISDGGSVEVVLSSSQNISLVQVRDIMRANATANAPSVSGAEAESSAGVTTSVSNIHLEVETDTIAPVISNVAAGITTTTATITWTTNENSDSQVEYGTDQTYGQLTTLNPALVTAHSQDLSGLTPGRDYHYRVKSMDAFSNLAVSGDFTFTTADTIAPVISNVAAGGITSSRTTITWTTDENSDSQVEYGLTTAYGQSAPAAPNPTLVTTHSQSLSGLTAETVYHYRVKSKDAGGNLAVSGDFTFTTAPLVISNVAAGGITTTGATIIWTTNENSDSQVEYGPTTSYGQSTTFNPALVTAHSQVLSGLTAGILYHYRVKSRDASGNLAVSGDFTFTTAQNGSAAIKWLVTDHLGSTRMVIDETGSLAGIKRHDFLPFGEELSAGVGIRSAALGYGADSTRQKFTGKERDDETGLDFFLARYYSNIQGRFTSVDPENAGAIEDDPQSWNGYAYARNAPAVYSDPDGRKYIICSPDGKECYEHSDENFNDGRRAGKKDGFTFSGDGKYFEKGEIHDKDGNVIATYQQTSLDDPAHELAFHMQAEFGKPDLYIRSVGNVVSGAMIGALLGGGTIKVNRITTTSPSRSAALTEAKLANGIPLSRGPNRTIKPNTPEGINAGLRSGDNVRLYEYTNSSGQKIWIREDKAASYGAPGGRGDQGPHFNSGPAGGDQKDLKNHHYWSQ